MTGVTVAKKQEGQEHKALSTSRFIIHLLVVGVAYVLGHLQVEDSIKRWFAVSLCVAIVLFDQLRFRLHVLAGMNQWLKEIGALRSKELYKSSNATHLAGIIGFPLLCQVPIWILVPSVATFAAGDAFAREFGKRFGMGTKVWPPHGDKTWVGYWSYTLSGNVFGLITILWLNHFFPLYPREYSDGLLSAGVIVSTFVGAGVELWCEKIPPQHSSYLDDNLVVPVVTGLVFYTTVLAGAAM